MFGMLFATSSSMRATKSLLLGTCRNVFCASFFIDILIVFVTLKDNDLICQSSSATKVHKENGFCRRFKPYIFASCSFVILRKISMYNLNAIIYIIKIPSSSTNIYHHLLDFVQTRAM